MEQGFAAEGFAPAPAVERVAANAIAKARHAPTPSAQTKTPPSDNHETQRRVVGAAEAGITKLGHTGKPTMEDRTISTLEGVRNIGNSVWAPGWMTVGNVPLPLPVLPAVGWAATKMKLKNVAALINMPLRAITESLGNLKLNEIHKMPAHMLHTASVVAEEAQGAMIQRTAAPLARAAHAAGGFMDNFAGNVSLGFAPVRQGITGAVSRLSESGSVGKSIANALGKAASVAAKSNLFVSAVATAAVAGTTASFMTANRERKQANALLEEIKAEIGPNHPIVMAAAQKSTKRTLTGLFGATLNGVGEVLGIKIARGLTAITQGQIVAAQGKMGVAQMGLAMGSGVVVSDNELLTACGLARSGVLKGEDLAKAYITMLAVKDSVKANGGEYNTLARHMAQDLASRGASFREVAALVKDEKAFNAFATEVKAKFDAKAKPAEAAPAAAPAASMVEAAYQAAPKPAAVALAAGAAHQGNLATAPAKAMG